MLLASKMKKAITGAVALLGLISYGDAAGKPAQEKPNVIVILADDLGYADVGFQGCKDIPTPNLDALAAGGVRFTSGYVTWPACAPSRASLIAGRDSHRFGFYTNPTPVLAGIVQYRDQILLARNAAWPGRRFALITGFMEAGETPEEGITREIAEETNLQVSALKLIGVYDFQRMNQVIIAYHAVADGEVRLSPELAEYNLYNYEDIICWPAGTGYAMGDWLRTQGIEPRFMSWDERAAQNLE
jgi:ADP-ribose pyrophosphatase YjhB (NUDIX family)